MSEAKFVYINFSSKFSPIPDYKPIDLSGLDILINKQEFDIDLELLPYSEELPEKSPPKPIEKFEKLEKEEKKTISPSNSITKGSSKNSPLPEPEERRRSSSSAQVNAIENINKSKEELKRISNRFKVVIESLKSKNVSDGPSSISPNGKRRRNSASSATSESESSKNSSCASLIDPTKKSLTPTNSPRNLISQMRNIILKSNKEEDNPFQFEEIEEVQEKEIVFEEVFPSDLSVEERLWYLGLK